MISGVLGAHQEARIGAQTLNMVFQDWGGVEEAKIGSAVVDDGRC